MQPIASLSMVLLTFAAVAHVRGEYKELQWTVNASSGVTIRKVDVVPMPILNPGEAFLTFHADLIRPIKTIRTVLHIVRTVTGISLPVRCYKVNGVHVGSCDYADLCVVLQSLLPSFKPETCPAGMANYDIDCRCPFNIPVRTLNIDKEKMEVPDAQSSIATFMASGDFSIRLETYDSVGLYADITIKFTVKSAKSSG